MQFQSCSAAQGWYGMKKVIRYFSERVINAVIQDVMSVFWSDRSVISVWRSEYLSLVNKLIWCLSQTSRGQLTLHDCLTTSKPRSHPLAPLFHDNAAPDTSEPTEGTTPIVWTMHLHHGRRVLQRSSSSGQSKTQTSWRPRNKETPADGSRTAQRMIRAQRLRKILGQRSKQNLGKE